MVGQSRLRFGMHRIDGFIKQQAVSGARRTVHGEPAAPSGETVSEGSGCRLGRPRVGYTCNNFVIRINENEGS